MKRRSRAALLVCYLLLVAAHLYYPKWQQAAGEATISYDVSGYYMYLPAVFIYHDLRELKFLPDIIAEYRPTDDPYQAFTTPDGDRVMKYSLGQSLLYAPFFGLAHAYATAHETYPADGFSLPYQLGVSLSALCFSFFGLYLLCRVLRRYYTDGVVAVTLLLITFATNYLNYSAIDGALTHNYLFTLYALLILLTDRLYRRQRLRWTDCAGIGLLLGLMALVRPTEILAALIPVFWATSTDRQALLDRLVFFSRHAAKIGLAAVLCLAVGSLQLLYWYYVSGHWIVYSYQDQGFDWLHPHILDGMFSYKAGWLTYTPVMWLTLLGFFPLYLRRQGTFLAAILHTALFIYVAFAWSVWWYGGSLGQRTMVQVYPVLAFPLAATVAWVATQRGVWRGVFTCVCLFCVAHNLWFTHQAHRGGLFVTEWMNGAYYWRTLFTFERDNDNFLLLDNPEYYRGLPSGIDTLYINDFESGDGRRCPQLSSFSGSAGYCVSDSVQNTPEFAVDVPLAPQQWVEVAADFLSSGPRWNIHNSAQLVLRFYRDGAMVKENIVRLHRVLNEEPNRRVKLQARAPREGADALGVLEWNGGAAQPPLLMDNLTVVTLE